MNREQKPAPARKEPGLLAKSVNTVISLIAWLVAALLLSIVIEWLGMAVVWPAQGEQHAQQLLQTERRYLDQRFLQPGQVFGRSVYRHSQALNHWLENKSGIKNSLARLSPSTVSMPLIDLQTFYQYSRPYLLAAFYITQLFFVRLALLMLSLPVFIVFAAVGLVDGLVERYLRRLGGGRESSNVYNLARKSLMPVLIAAGVIYISLPVSVHPAFISLPFAWLLGFSVKMTFEKLKKYF